MWANEFRLCIRFYTRIEGHKAYWTSSEEDAIRQVGRVYKVRRGGGGPYGHWFELRVAAADLINEAKKREESVALVLLPPLARIVAEYTEGEAWFVFTATASSHPKEDKWDRSDLNMMAFFEKSCVPVSQHYTKKEAKRAARLLPGGYIRQLQGLPCAPREAYDAWNDRRVRDDIAEYEKRTA